MRLRLLVVISIVLAFGVAVSVASAGEGNPPNPRKACTKGHWQQWKSTGGGQLFKSEDKCLSYLARYGNPAFNSSRVLCESNGGTFSTDPEAVADVPGGILGELVWTCNGIDLVAIDPSPPPNLVNTFNDSCLSSGGNFFQFILGEWNVCSIWFP